MRTKFSFSLLLIVLILPLSQAEANTAKFRNTTDVTITIFAASSLSSAFLAIAREFEIRDPSVHVRFSFLASSVLATQLSAGAPADIFAAASKPDMLAAASRVPVHRFFASNRIVLAVAKNGHIPITKLQDLNQRKIKWIQCAHSVACGVATDTALKSLKIITTRPVSLEAKVSSVVAKLIDREVDAAFIYHSDFVANSKILREIAFPESISSKTRYFIGVVKDSEKLIASKRFVNEVLSPRGQKLLSQSGFGGAR